MFEALLIRRKSLGSDDGSHTTTKKERGGETTVNVEAEKKIMSLWDENFKAERDGDIETVMKIYAEDAFIQVHGAPEITGHDIIRNIYKNHFEAAIESNSWVTDLEVAESCDLAYGKGKFRSQMKGPDGPYWNEGKFLLTMKKTEGEWKLTGLCYTDDQIRT